ncbi:MAG TPA: hypothetical protein VFU49_23290, partial [Ktedonobacteraceae bacterium]|nr:hypothetical protein [Ktedonobacteraceae bacterium]
MYTYRSRSRSGRYNAMLFQSILALLVLHQSGASYKFLVVGKGIETELEQALVSVAGRVYGEEIVKKMLRAYGLNSFEHCAIQAYSSPNKSDKELNGTPNPYYMGKAVMWGMYEDGWTALASALKKLPSLGDLGLILTTYRATRTKKSGETMEAAALKKLAPESHVQLGMKVMDMGQYHYTSTAITYNPHWGRAIEVGGVIAITGYSGVYINPFGLQTYVDGGEILYGPGILTTYEGMNPTGYQTSQGTVPVFHLREVRKPETGQRVVEDSEFELRQDRDPRLDKAKMAIIQKIEAIVQIYGSDVVAQARKATKINGPIMYLTYDELKLLYQNLPQIPQYQPPVPQPSQYQASASSSQASAREQLIAEIESMMSQPGCGGLAGDATLQLNIRGPIALLGVEQLTAVLSKMKEIAAKNKQEK